MRPDRVGLLVGCLVATWIFEESESFAVLPPTILIQGALTGAGGSPISGTRTWQVRFFDAASAGSQLGTTQNGSTPVSAEGVFNIAVTPPYEVSIAPAVWYDLGVDTDVPPDAKANDDTFPDRVQVHSAPFAHVAAALGGEACVMTSPGPSAGFNGIHLGAAYARAKALTPHGLGRSATNRVVLLVLPGRYDLAAGQLTMDTEFVDLIGVSSARENQILFSITNGAGTGVLRQTANDVRIENLTVECRRVSGSLLDDASDPAAYFPDGNRTATRVRNCEFRALNDGVNGRSMRIGLVYNGLFENCVGGLGAFGGGDGGASGAASGTFIDCVGGDNAFGGDTAAGGGSASGKFTRCLGGDRAFGAFGFASGTFIDCVADDNSFGYLGTASGKFTNCTGDVDTFGGGDGGVASGTFMNCTGASGSFAGGGNGALASGTFTNCVSTGSAFGLGGTVTGTFTNCVGGAGSFGGGASGVTTGAKLYGCRMTGSFLGGTFTGRMENCRWEAGMTLGAAARIYGSTFNGVLDLNNTNAGVTQSRADGFVNDAGNRFGATNAAALNMEDSDVQ